MQRFILSEYFSCKLKFSEELTHVMQPWHWDHDLGHFILKKNPLRSQWRINDHHHLPINSNVLDGVKAWHPRRIEIDYIYILIIGCVESMTLYVHHSLYIYLDFTNAIIFFFIIRRKWISLLSNLFFNLFFTDRCNFIIICQMIYCLK